jgi:hypothetical protein
VVTSLFHKLKQLCRISSWCNSVYLDLLGIWRVQKRFPQYGIPIWNLLPNIRFPKNILGRTEGQTNRQRDGRTERGFHKLKQLCRISSWCNSVYLDLSRIFGQCIRLTYVHILHKYMLLKKAIDTNIRRRFVGLLIKSSTWHFQPSGLPFSMQKMGEFCLLEFLHL